MTELTGRVERLEIELGRVERLEKNLAFHEIVLAKKVSDVKRIEEMISKLATKESFEAVRKELKKLSKHEELIFEAGKCSRELLNEISKLRDSHIILKDQFSLAGKDADLRLEALREELKQNRKQKPTEMADRIEQLEYQNRLMLKYLKELEHTRSH